MTCLHSIRENATIQFFPKSFITLSLSYKVSNELISRQENTAFILFQAILILMTVIETVNVMLIWGCNQAKFTRSHTNKLQSITPLGTKNTIQIYKISHCLQSITLQGAKNAIQIYKISFTFYYSIQGTHKTNKKPQRNTYTVTAYFSVGGKKKIMFSYSLLVQNVEFITQHHRQRLCESKLAEGN